MRTCEYDGAPFPSPRSHPWTDAAANPAFRYRDFKADTAAIRTSLEDFAPWGGEAAIEAFYQLVTWLNSPGCPLESNDCEFTGPHPNESPSFAKRVACSGRIMVLYRVLGQNRAWSRIAALKDGLHHRLGARDPDFAWGMIGTTIVPVRYLELPGARAAQLGHQLMISFWAWGDTEPELMENLERLVRNLSVCLIDWGAGWRG